MRKKVRYRRLIYCVSWFFYHKRFVFFSVWLPSFGLGLGLGMCLPWGQATIPTNVLHLSLSSVIVIISLVSWPHHAQQDIVDTLPCRSSWLSFAFHHLLRRSLTVHHHAFYGRAVGAFSFGWCPSLSSIHSRCGLLVFSLHRLLRGSAIWLSAIRNACSTKSWTPTACTDHYSLVCHMLFHFYIAVAAYTTEIQEMGIYFSVTQSWHYHHYHHQVSLILEVDKRNYDQKCGEIWKLVS